MLQLNRTAAKAFPYPATPNDPGDRFTPNYYQRLGIQTHPHPIPDQPPRFSTCKSMVDSLQVFNTVFGIHPNADSDISIAYRNFARSMYALLQNYTIITGPKNPLMNTFDWSQVPTNPNVDAVDPCLIFDPRVEEKR